MTLTPSQPGVTVWDRKRPEPNPDQDVKLPDGLMMPPAASLNLRIDLEDWISEAEKQMAADDQLSQVFITPVVTSLVAGGCIALLSPGGAVAGVSIIATGCVVLLLEIVATLFRRRRLVARWRRVDAYRRRLRDLAADSNGINEVSAAGAGVHPSRAVVAEPSQ